MGWELHPYTYAAGTGAVGQFKELVESAERDQPLQQCLIKALNLTGKVRTRRVPLP